MDGHQQLSDPEYAEARSAALNAILQSDSRLKLIVAGPGTGKTFTFQALLGQTEGQSLAMTFLLVLVHDLDSKFDDSVDVYSFHGFARKLLHQIDVEGVTRGVQYYPPLAGLVVEDIRISAEVILDEMHLGSLYRSLADTDSDLVRALSIGNYYNAVAHDDAVYRVLKALEANPNVVPTYSQLVVDEFQDFCPMEVAFIGLLAEKSPTLIVGDDDQALYAFRDATPQAIRDLAASDEYARFDLPFCTRCTEVLVASTHTVVSRAEAIGLLAGRLEKQYNCYLPDKRAESDRYPSIRRAHCSVQTNASPYMSKYVEYLISEIDEEEIRESHAEGFPTVLIIGPNPFLAQIESHLRKHFAQVNGPSRFEGGLDILEAYRMLAQDPNSNLGWRILIQLLQPGGWEDAVRTALAANSDLVDCLDLQFVEQHRVTAELLARCIAGEEGSPLEREALAAALGIAADRLEARLATPDTPGAPELDETAPTILLTSLMGSKGLQAAHVFIVGMNEEHFPRDNSNPTNEEVCQLLVALTRGRKSCTLVSTGRLGASQKQRSEFLEWLAPHTGPEEYVNKAYLDNLGL
jgi:hypothetical protein